MKIITLEQQKKPVEPEEIREVEILDFEKEIGHELVVKEIDTSSSTVTLNGKKCKYIVQFERSRGKVRTLSVPVGKGETIDEAIINYCENHSNTDVDFFDPVNDSKIIQLPKLIHTRKALEEVEKPLTPNQAIKPPLGLTPRFACYSYMGKQERILEIYGAISRYSDAKLPIKIEWVEEYNELIKE